MMYKINTFQVSGATLRKTPCCGGGELELKSWMRAVPLVHCVGLCTNVGIEILLQFPFSMRKHIQISKKNKPGRFCENNLFLVQDYYYIRKQKH